MNQYRKKPVVVEATQWHKHGDHPKVVALPVGHPIDPSAFGWVLTLEGGHVVAPGDWIITGVKGEHYPCKPDIFAATYEPVIASAPAEVAQATEFCDGDCIVSVVASRAQAAPKGGAMSRHADPLIATADSEIRAALVAAKAPEGVTCFQVAPGEF